MENISGNIKFDNAIIKGFLDIRNVYLKHITFNGTVVTGNIQDNNTLLPSIQDRNTARLLKHEAKKINNNISASNYFQIEMSIYNKSLKSWNLNDRILLGLNQLSNKHGLSWSRGAFFTILFGLLFYSLFIMSRDGFGFFWNNNWDFLLNNESFWAGFINFFWLPTGFNQLIDKTSTYMFGGGIGAGFFILGKITIAYGIYQTISAFRKYF